MADKTFKEKYVDQKIDMTFAWTLMTEFIATIIFIFTIMNLVVIPVPTAYAAFVIASIALCVIYAFGPRCGAPFNPAIVTGLMFGGKMNIIKGKCSLF
jgi:glycerol uptake facilitator-like aquaporin